jgi:hypothetical protein
MNNVSTTLKKKGPKPKAKISLLEVDLPLHFVISLLKVNFDEKGIEA